MSRMPGRGTSPGSCIIGSALYGKSRRREWYRVAAERQQPLDRGTQFHAKGVEAFVRDRHKSSHLDQIGRLAATVAHDRGAFQPGARKSVRDPGFAYRSGTFRAEQGAIETTLLRSAVPDCQRIGIGTGVAARTERQARDYLRSVVVDR